MNRKNLLFGLVTVTAILLLAEAVLWIAGVETLASGSDPYRGFAAEFRVFRQQDDVYRPHPDALAHSFNDQRFLAEKPEDGYRVFVLGGSSAYGFPWDARSAFSHSLGVALQASFPDRRIESVNAAAMSYGSHRLRILAAELLDYEPDALVVYGGHNEFIERRFYSDLMEKQEALPATTGLLARSRIYSGMTRLIENLKPTAAEEPQDLSGKSVGELLGFDVRREQRKDVDDAERAEVRARFRENLEAIVAMARERGVDVVLCTVPSNVSGWVPNQSSIDPGIEPETVRAIEAALERAQRVTGDADAGPIAIELERLRGLAPGHAGIHFRLGQAYETLGRPEEARAAYALARDLDGQPARAVGSLNETIRDVARERDATLVDVEAIFEAEAPGGLLGFNLFEDYVHPKPAAHRRIGLELWRAFLERGLVGETRSADAGVFERAVGALGAAGNAAGPEASLDAKTPAKLFNLAVVLDNQGLYDEAIEKYEACLELNPLYTYARSNLGRLYARKGRHAEAAAAHRRALQGEPQHMPSVLGLGHAYLALDRLDEAVEQFRLATQTDPGSVNAWGSLGTALYRMKNHVEAERATRRALELEPDNVDLRADLGWALFSQKKVEEARTEFEAALARDRHHAKALNGLGGIHLHYDERAEAEAAFRRVLALDPGDLFAQRGMAILARRAQPTNP